MTAVSGIVTLILVFAWALATRRTPTSTQMGLLVCAVGSGAAYRATSANPTLGNAAYSVLIFLVSSYWLRDIAKALRT